MYQDEVSFKQAGSIFRHWALEGYRMCGEGPAHKEVL